MISLLQTDRNKKELVISVPESWGGLTIEQLLRNVWQLPKKMVHQYRMEKSIRINKKPASFQTIIEKGDRLTIPVSIENESKIDPTDLDIPILYEDEHILIANKPANMATHPNEPGDRNTLLNGIVHYLIKKGEAPYIQHVHRLDKDTTGAILLAKHPLAKSLFDRLLNERKVERMYTALVTGRLQKKTGTIDANIGRDRHHGTRRRVSKTGKEAITHYQVIGFDPERNLTQVLCKLETGRTHQIRVHFAHIGHPLAGDTLYGGKPIFPRQALHAKYLSFKHPITLEKIQVEAPYLDHPPIFLDQ